MFLPDYAGDPAREASFAHFKNIINNAHAQALDAMKRRDFFTAAVQFKEVTDIANAMSIHHYASKRADREAKRQDT